MGRITKRERIEIRRREQIRVEKEKRMKRGDEMRALESVIVSEPVEKPISAARQNRLALEYLTADQLEKFIKDKIMYSKICFSEGIKASVEEFHYNSFKSGFGIKLDFQGSDSGRQHFFGFELINHSERPVIRIHYAAVREDGVNYKNDYKDIRPKHFSARELVDIVGQYR